MSKYIRKYIREDDTMKHDNISDQGFGYLVAGIVNRAVDDYFNYRFVLDIQELYPAKNNKVRFAYNQLDDVVHFFKSDWYRLICPLVKSKTVLNVLNTRYYEEYFFNQLNIFYKTREDKIPKRKFNAFKSRFIGKYYTDRVSLEERMPYYETLIIENKEETNG